MKIKKINVLVPDADGGMTMSVVRCLKGLPNIVLHGSGHDAKNGFRLSRFTKSFTLLNDALEDAHIQQLLKIINDKKIDVILPIRQDTYRFLAANKSAFENHTRLPTMATTEIFEIVTNKYHLARFCELHEISSPRTAYLEDYEKEKNGLSLPLIVKPERGWGGNNVYHIQSESDFSSIVHKENMREGKYIVQEYVDGYDIDMSMLAKNGELLAYTIQKGLIKRANQFAASAGLEFLENNGVFEPVAKLVKELKFSGIAHVDLRYDKHTDTYKIIEINARYWGSLIASHLAGVNFPYFHILSSLDKEIPSSSATPIRYMDFITGVKLVKNTLFSKQKLGFRWKDTDFSFIITDPVAEMYNAWKRSRH